MDRDSHGYDMNREGGPKVHLDGEPYVHLSFHGEHYYWDKVRGD